MLIGLIVVGDQVVDAFKEGRQRTAVVLLLKQELFLREDLNEVDEAVACFTTETFGVRREVRNDGDDGFVDRFE